MKLEAKRILVTGGTGFIGSYVLSSLRQRGADALGIARSVPASADAGPVRAVDMLDENALDALLREVMPGCVVHLAAVRNRQIDLSEISQGYGTNLAATLNLLRGCERVGCRPKFIFLGSCEEYGACQTPFEETAREMPTSAYGLSKLAATQLVQAVARTHATASVILRPALVYGPGQAEDMFLPSLVNALLANREFPMTAGEQTRDYVFVDDVVDSILRAVAIDLAPGTLINVSSNMPILLKDLALQVARAIGPHAGALIRFGMRSYRANEVMHYSACNRRARELLSWTPRTSLESGLARTIASMRR